MTLESEINKKIKTYLRLVDEDNDDSGTRYYRLSPTKDLGEELDPHNFSTDTGAYLTQPIDKWIWTGEPTSFQLASFSYIKEASLLAALEIDFMIWQASYIEAATSPSEYIREFKRWQQVLEKTKDKDRKHLEDNNE